MSDFSNIPAVPTKSIDEDLIRAFNRPIIGAPKSFHEENPFQWGLHKLGKIEEIKTKALGQLFSSDPKYDHVFGESDYWTQVGFYTLFEDMGFNEKNMGVMGPISAAALGIASAIADPTSILNKFSVGRLTKTGTIARQIKNAEGLVEIEKEGKRLWQLSTKGTEDYISKGLKDIDGNSLEAGILRQRERSLKNAQESLKNTKNINTVLEQLQLKGVSIDDLKLADTMYKRVKLGQQHVLGFSDPRKFGHLSMFGIARDELSNASTIPLTPRWGQLAFAKVVEGVRDVVKSGSKKFMETLKTVSGNRLASQIFSEQKYRDAIMDVRKNIQEGRGTVADMENVWMNMINEYKLNETESRAVLDTLEAGMQPEHRYAGKFIDNLKKKQPDFFNFGVAKGAKEVKDLSTELDANDILNLSPSGLNKVNDLPRAVSQFNAGSGYPSIIDTSGNETKLTGDFVVTRINNPKTEVTDFNALNKVYGFSAYARYSQTGAEYLVAKKLPGGKIASDKNLVSLSHKDNIEAILAHLSKQRKTLSKLDTNDILLNNLGGIQIINPDIVVSVASSKIAREQSSAVLENFIRNNSLLPEGEMRQTKYLASAKATKSAPKVVRKRILGDELRGPLGNIDRMLSEAVNIDPERAALNDYNNGGDITEFARANNIDNEVTKLVAQINRGESPIIPKITIGKDMDNNLYIVEGADRLMAAKLLGFDVVPIQVREAFGENLDLTRTYYHGHMSKLENVFRSDPVPANGFPNTVNTSFVPDNYRIIEKGDFLTPSLNDFSTESSKHILRILSELSQVGLKQSISKSKRPSLLLTSLTKQFGADNVALTSIANLAIDTDLPIFTEQLRKVTGSLANKSNLLNPLNNIEAVSLFDELKAYSEAHLGTLAKRGILTNSTIQKPQYLSQVLTGNKRSLHILDSERNKLSVLNAGTSVNKVKEEVDAFLRKHGGAEDIDPFAIIAIHGSDQTLYTKVSDFVTEKQHKLADIINTRAVFHIGKDTLEDWKTRLGVWHNPNAKELPEYIGGVLVNVKDDQKPIFPFFFTRSGDMFLGTRHTNIPSLLKDIFGRGPIYAQETGLILPGRVVIQDPLGSLMDTMGRRELNVLERRIKFIAKKMDNAGLAKSHTLEVNTSFENGVWKAIYGDKTTIGDVLEKGWKLKLPELVDGLQVIPNLDISTRIVGIKHTQFKNPNQTKLFKFLSTHPDKLFVKEVLEGLPVKYGASYVPRFITQATRDALNQAGLEYAEANPKFISHFESFFKKRTITDLTLGEVNDLTAATHKLIDEGKIKGLEFDDIVTNVVEFAMNKFDKTLEPRLAKWFTKIVNFMPSGSKFFYDNAILANAMRYEAGVRAITRNRVLGSLKEHGLVIEASPSDMAKIKRGYDDVIGTTDIKLMRLREERIKVSDDIDKLGQTNIHTPTKQKLLDKTNKMDLEIAKLESKKMKDYKAFVGKHGIIAQDIDTRNLYVAGDQAAKLVREGLIDSKDLVNAHDDFLVKLPIEKYASTLERGGIKVYAFNSDMAPLITRYLSSMNRSGFTEFLSTWDKINNIWIVNTLFPIPEFHIRNIVSLAYMSWAAGITDIRNMEDSFRMSMVIRKMKQGTITRDTANDLLDEMKFFSDNGNQISARDLFSEFNKRGGISGGFAFNEHMRVSGNRYKEIYNTLVKTGGAQPSSEFFGNILTDWPGVKFGIKAHQYIESQFRLSGFLDEWRKTGSLDSAETKMKAIFYDYSDLSMFERDVLKRIYPFYSWLRHNIPAQVKSLIMRPDVYLRWARFSHAIEQGALNYIPPDESGLPDYFKNSHGIIMYKDKDGKYVGKIPEGIVPSFDLIKLFTGEGVAETIASGITPFLKFPIEQLANYSFFTKEQIETVPGEPTRSAALGYLGFSQKAGPHGPLGILNIALNDSALRDFFRLGNKAASLLDNFIDKKNWIDGSPSINMALISLILGKGQIIDPNRTRAIKQAKLRDMLQKFDGIEKYYKTIGDENGLRATRNMRLQFLLEDSGK